MILDIIVRSDYTKQELAINQAKLTANQILDDIHKIITSSPDCGTVVFRLGSYSVELMEAIK